MSVADNPEGTLICSNKKVILEFTAPTEKWAGLPVSFHSFAKNFNEEVYRLNLTLRRGARSLMKSARSNSDYPENTRHFLIREWLCLGADFSKPRRVGSQLTSAREIRLPLLRWRPSDATVVYVEAIPFGLAVIEMTQTVSPVVVCGYPEGDLPSVELRPPVLRFDHL